MDNCNVKVLNALCSDDFESRTFDVVSLISSLAAKAKSRTSVISFSFSLYKLNRKIASSLGGLHEVLEGRKAPSSCSDEPISRQRILAIADNFDFCHRAIECIYEGARRARMTNNSRIAGNLLCLRKFGDEMQDIAMWLETLADEAGVKKIFDRAEQEKESGEIYDLSQV